MYTNSATYREIDSRSNGGVTVTLYGYFDLDGTCAFAVVEVESDTENFIIREIPLSSAVEVYRHPFFYASRELSCGRLVA